MKFNAARWLRVLLVSGIVVPFSLFALNSWQTHNAAIRESDLRLSAKARLLREQVAERMETNRLAIALVDKMLGNMTWDDIAKSEQVRKQLSDLDHSFPQINSIVVMNPDDVVANASQIIRRDISVADRPWVARLHDPKTAQMVITPLHSGRVSQRLQFVVVQRRSSPNGRYNGLIAVSNAPIRGFMPIFRGLTIHESFSLALDDGAVLVSNVPNAPTQIPHELINQLGTRDVLAFPNGMLERVEGFPLLVSYSLDSSTLHQWENDVILDAVTLCFGSWFVIVTCIIAMRSHARENATNEQLQEEMKRRQNAEVEIAHSRRLEALGQLTAGVAHDFNNLLTVVIGNAEPITYSEDGKLKARAKNILTAAQRGATLVAQMLTFARRQMIQITPYDVTAGLQQYTAAIAAKLKPSVRLIMAQTAEPLTCYLDVDEFRLAILNIVSNADQAMPTGGQLSIQSEIVVRYIASHPCRYARITFEDTGEGMSQEVKERAFEPFFTTRVFATTGLGLSQVYGFVKQAGGEIAIESEVDHGTKVILYLPMNEPHPKHEASPPRIVVVDDQADILDIFGPALEHHGFVVFCTQEPAQALAYLDNHECNLLLTDVVMPAMYGTDLAKRAQANHPHVKVLLMTGYAADLKDYPIIRKPFRINELLNRIRMLLNESWTL